jgi:sugar phosphate isomerase/epimerase
MRVTGSRHLGYCTNIHPGESWGEVRASLEHWLPRVKALASPDAPLGVGLRLSAAAADALASPDALAAFAGFLRRHDLYVFTLNGFPYGAFHGTRVKERVYRPDWRDEARLAYTDRLADLLAALLPAGGLAFGSVSTVPGAFRPDAGSAQARARIADALIRHAAHLHALARSTGHEIALALEPEPCCMLETVAETVAFFAEHLHSAAAAARLAALSGIGPGDAADALRRHLGVCLDLCHAAVEFEEPADCLDALEHAGIRIAKIQVTAGLRLAPVTAIALDALRRFDDGVYLHQVVERCADGRLVRHLDIGAACDSGGWRDDAREWRVHLHVPVFVEALEGFRSTQAFVREALRLHRQRARSPHLEVETYTFGVLPPSVRDIPLDQAIARELGWVRQELA